MDSYQSPVQAFMEEPFIGVDVWLFTTSAFIKLRVCVLCMDLKTTDECSSGKVMYRFYLSLVFVSFTSEGAIWLSVICINSQSAG